jgi:hypothetical protein
MFAEFLGGLWQDFIAQSNFSCSGIEAVIFV